MPNTITDVGGIKNVRMANSNFARAPIPSTFDNWSIIRVALLVQISDSGVSITGTPRLAVGLCSGSSNIIGDATTTHFCGVMSNNTTWTRATGGIRYQMSSTFVPSKKVGTTVTIGSAMSLATSACIHTEGPSMFMVDITKGSPNYSFNLMMFASAAIVAVTDADFELQAVTGIPAFRSHARSSGFSLAVNEGTDGVFDHAGVWWNQVTPTIDILNWGVYRVS